MIALLPVTALADQTLIPAPSSIAGPPAPERAPGEVVDLNPRPLGAARAAKAPAQPAATGAVGASGVLDSPLVRTAGSLAIVLGLIVGLAALARKFGGKGVSLARAMGPGGRAPAGVLEILGRYPIARGQTLILLKVDQRVVLVGQTSPRLRGGNGSLSTLCEVTDSEEVASILLKTQDESGASQAKRFTGLLSAFERQSPDPSEEEDGITLRSVRHGPGGDRAELWDERAVVHQFPTVTALPEREGLRAVQRPAVNGAGGGGAGGGGDEFGSLRDRLSALRGEAHR